MYGFRVTSAALSITVDRVSPVPLYAQVSAQIEHAIESGALEPGFKLENEIALAEQLGLSRPTMRRAIQDLVGKGLLVRKRGVGTQVVHGRVRREVKLTSLYDDLSKAGKVPGTKVLTNVVQPAPAPVAEELHTPAGDPVLHLERLRLAGGEPLAILRNWLPGDLLSPSDDDLEPAAIPEGEIEPLGIRPQAESADEFDDIGITAPAARASGAYTEAETRASLLRDAGRRSAGRADRREPFGPVGQFARAAESAQADGLHHLADGSGLYQFACLDGSFTQTLTHFLRKVRRR